MINRFIKFVVYKIKSFFRKILQSNSDYIMSIDQSKFVIEEIYQLVLRRNEDSINQFKLKASLNSDVRKINSIIAEVINTLKRNREKTFELYEKFAFIYLELSIPFKIIKKSLENEMEVPKEFRVPSPDGFFSGEALDYINKYTEMEDVFNVKNWFVFCDQNQSILDTYFQKEFFFEDPPLNDLLKLYFKNFIIDDISENNNSELITTRIGRSIKVTRNALLEFGDLLSKIRTGKRFFSPTSISIKLGRKYGYSEKTLINFLNREIKNYFPDKKIEDITKNDIKKICNKVKIE